MLLISDSDATDDDDVDAAGFYADGAGAVTNRSTVSFTFVYSVLMLSLLVL